MVSTHRDFQFNPVCQLTEVIDQLSKAKGLKLNPRLTSKSIWENLEIKIKSLSVTEEKVLKIQRFNRESKLGLLAN
jgi:hypothetical protein